METPPTIATVPSGVDPLQSLMQFVLSGGPQPNTGDPDQDDPFGCLSGYGEYHNDGSNISSTSDSNTGDGDADDDTDDETESEAEAEAKVPEPLTDLDRILVLDDDPLVALKINDAHRRADVPDGPESDLWSIDQVRAVLPRQYKYPVPTFAPRCWAAPLAVSQAEYTKRFKAEFPEIMAVLPIDNIVVAGGAGAWPLGEPTARVSDIDLFVYGLDPTDRAALWRKLSLVVRKVTAALLAAGAQIVTQVLSPGLVTLTAHRGSGGRWWRDVIPTVKVQVILRAYPSVSAILHAFDVPSCSVAFDGLRAYTTTLGAYAQVFRANLVSPAYRSTTYEARLAKYFRRGYALVLPNLRPGLLAKGEPLVLPHLTLQPLAVRGFFAAGSLAEVPESPFAKDSDYGPHYKAAHGRTQRAIAEGTNYGGVPVNVLQLASGERRFIILGYAVRDTERARSRHRATVETNKEIRFDRFATKAEPSLSEILPRARLEKYLTDCVRWVLNPVGRLNVRALKRVFGLSEPEIARLITEIEKARQLNPGRRLDLAPALARPRTALLERYTATPAAIAWWITQEPGRQFTASIDPRMEDPAQWYGEAFTAELKAPSSEDFIESLLATLEARQGIAGGDKPIYDGVCPLCQEPLARGDPNSVILPCGHIFHWAAARDDCSGLYTWVTDDHGDCPSCRARFDMRAGARFGPDADSEDEPEPVPIDIAW